jgi:hypothetical protein
MQRISNEQIMSAQKCPFTGSLLEAMHRGDAKSRGLRAALAAPPDESDQIEHHKNELRARWVELSKFFGLDTSASNICEQLTKALVEREFGIRSDDPRWWERLAIRMAIRNVPGFSIKGANEKKHGAPLEWTLEQFARLFADIEFLKKKCDGSVRAISVQLLKEKGYRARWGRYSPGTLRKNYSRAVKLQKTSPEFLFILYGGDAFIDAKGINLTDVPIQQHALGMGID